MSGAASVKFALDALLQGAQIGIFDLKRLGLTATRDLLGTLRPHRLLAGVSTFRALFGPDDDDTRRLAQDVRWIRLGNERVLPSDVALTDVASPRRAGWSFQSARRKPAPMRRGRSTTLRPSSGHWFPVGRPLSGVSLELIGDDGVTVMLGEIGEICVTSATVARGYWRDEALTAARFSPLPENPAIMRYRTGDYGRFLPSGLLEFVGRRDRQVKLRGNTVNLGEVEAILGGYPDLGEVGIVARECEQDTVLVAYCAPATGCVLGEERLRQWCRTHLPAPMQPAQFFKMTALPRLPAGKIDLIALAALDARKTDAFPPHAPASEAAEATPFLDAVRGVDKRSTGTILRGRHVFRCRRRQFAQGSRLGAQTRDLARPSDCDRYAGPGN